LEMPQNSLGDGCDKIGNKLYNLNTCPQWGCG
jgi:hypothetical protein